MNEPSIPRSYVVGLLLALAAGTAAVAWMSRIGHTPEEAPGKSPARPVVAPRPARSLDTAIRLAGEYLNRVCGESGKFEYMVNLNPAVAVKEDYNEVRHCGTIFAMATGWQRSRDEETRAAVLRATRYLREELMRPVADQPGAGAMAAVWYPATSDLKKPKRGIEEASLGGAGLGLVALVSVERMAPGTVPLEEMRSLARFIRWMQKPDGSYYAEWVPSEMGRNDTWQSLYYPGEAALGLTMLFEIDPQPEWIQAASDTILRLAETRRGQDDVPADHWALLATERLLPVLDRCPRPVSRTAAIEHARQVAAAMLRGIPRHADPDLRGCMTEDGRTTPTATRLEGLQAALGFLPAELETERRAIRAAVDAGMEFLMAAQVLEGPHAGAIPGAFKALPPDHRKAAKATPEMATEVRIDFVQHALSAFMQHEALRKR